jgi:serine/threonine-protein kinase 11
MSILVQTQVSPVFLLEDEPEKHIKKINQYALLEVVGYGATSKVFMAYDTMTDKPLAAKAISLCDGKHDGFALEREIRILRRLNHPNIIKLHEVLYTAKRRMAYVILEWASFGSLQAVLGLTNESNDLAAIFKQVCAGLSYLHQQGMVHQDIKPSNILLFSGGIAKLSDFGIGHSFDSADAVIGTPAYQAPEFFDDSGDVVLDPVKEDVWSLGISLYEAAFGKLPYEGDSVYQITWNMSHTPLIIPASASEPLRDLLSRMLEVEPAKRFNLTEVMSHPFISQAPDRFTLTIQPRNIPRMTPAKSMVDIAAVVCGEGFTFARRPRSLSWPEVEDDEETIYRA